MNILNNNIKEITEQYNTAYKWFEFINNKNEKVVIQSTICTPDNKNKNSLPNLWYKTGRTQEILKDYISLRTYVHNDDCRLENYNPQTKEEWYKNIDYSTKAEKWNCRHIINFDWLLPVSEANLIQLLNEVYRLANERSITNDKR